MELTPEIVFAIIQSDKQFPIDFDVAWFWVGYSRKSDAKELLESKFEKGFDFCGEVRKNSKRGRPVEKIFLTPDCFKQFCMMAGTQKGKEVRRYYLNCESELKRRIEEDRVQAKQNMQHQLVAAMVSDDVVSRQSKFPVEFYEMLYRKRGQGWETRDPKKFRPACVGTWTNQTVYNRMLGGTKPGGVKEALNRVNPRRENGTRKDRHHWHLKELGTFHLSTHLYALTAIANTVPDGDWDRFMYKVAQAFPNDEALQLTLWDIFEEMENPAIFDSLPSNI
jgi:phage anti-repressor protein